MKSHNIPEKVIKSTAWYKRFGMQEFFTRYELLEKKNFPLWTEMNAACLFIFIIGCFLLQIRDMEYKALSITMIAGSSISSLLLTYIFVAPTICRIRIVRRWYLIFVEYVICAVLANAEYVTGSNWHGYLPHLTARKIIDFEYVTEERFQEVSTLAIVRNPYARMVSIYMYNRFGPWETFSHFVRTWYDRTIKDYRERGEMEEWYTPCHAIPQFEYTHDTNGTKQLVTSVVKQEELKYLKIISSTVADPSVSSSGGVDATINMEANDDKHENNNSGENNADENEDEDDSGSICSKSSSITSSEECTSEGLTTNDFPSIRGLPDTIRKALLGMPHDNKRKTKMPWYEQYDQETLNLTYEMYHRDFEVFGYNVVLEQRPDLDMPPPVTRDVSV